MRVMDCVLYKRYLLSALPCAENPFDRTEERMCMGLHKRKQLSGGGGAKRPPSNEGGGVRRRVARQGRTS
jgi:hypothetical protein